VVDNFSSNAVKFLNIHIYIYNHLLTQPLLVIPTPTITHMV